MEKPESVWPFDHAIAVASRDADSTRPVVGEATPLTYSSINEIVYSPSLSYRHLENDLIMSQKVYMASW